MTAITEPLDLPDIRSYLAMDSDDTSEDPLLTDALSFCRDRLEAVLPYCISERDIIVKKGLCTWALMPTVDIGLKGPVLSVERVILTMNDGTETDAPETAWFIFDDSISLDLRKALSELDTDLRPVGVSVAYHAGAHVPPVVKNALLMMIRNRYERRDEDPLSDEVYSAVSGEVRVNI